MAAITKTPTRDERIATRRAELTTKRAARKDKLDIPRTLTDRQFNAYITETATIEHEFAAFTNEVEKWHALPSIELDTRWLAFAPGARDLMSTELANIKKPMRDRDVQELAARLVFSIRLLDFGLGISAIGPIIDLSSTRIGQLMQQAGYDVTGLELLRGPNGFRGSIPEVEARIKALTKQRAAVEAALDSALLTDDERTQRDVDDAAFREVLSTMIFKNNSTGNGLAAFSPDGDALAVADMTPVQRKAFERFQSAVWPSVSV